MIFLHTKHDESHCMPVHYFTILSIIDLILHGIIADMKSTSC